MASNSLFATDNDCNTVRKYYPDHNPCYFVVWQANGRRYTSGPWGNGERIPAIGLTLYMVKVTFKESNHAR